MMILKNLKFINLKDKNKFIIFKISFKNILIGKF